MHETRYGSGCKTIIGQSGKCTKKFEFIRINKTKTTRIPTQIKVSILDIVGLNSFLSFIIFHLMLLIFLPLVQNAGSYK